MHLYAIPGSCTFLCLMHARFWNRVIKCFVDVGEAAIMYAGMYGLFYNTQCKKNKFLHHEFSGAYIMV